MRLNLDNSPMHRMVPNRKLPWLFRLRPVWGTALMFIFGCGAIYVAYLQIGWKSLHGLWISAVILLTYLFLQDYFRLRVAIQELVSNRAESLPSEIIHYVSGISPNTTDYQFTPDENTKKNVGSEKCVTSVSDNVIKVIRPHSTGRYITTIKHYENTYAIPARNALSRRIRVSFEYKTSGPLFTFGVRLRDRKGNWLKNEDGSSCLEKFELNSTDWRPCPSILFFPAVPQQDFRVTLELLDGGNEPNQRAALLLRNIQITEDAE